MTAEKQVILFSHSNTGMPAVEAPVGLRRKERERKSLEGGLIRLVLIMSFAMPKGFQPIACGAQYHDWIRVDM